MRPTPIAPAIARNRRIAAKVRPTPSGVSAPGTVYRMDEIPLTLRPALKSPYATDEEIVNLLIAAVARRPGWRPAATAEMPEIA